MNISTFRRAAAAGTIAVLSLPSMAFAQGTATQELIKNVDVIGTTVGSKKDLPVLVASVITQAMGLLGIFLVCYIIYAGFLWMTDPGDGKKAAQAKGILKNSVIGLVLIFAAYSITSFIVTTVGTISQ